MRVIVLLFNAKRRPGKWRAGEEGAWGRSEQGTDVPSSVERKKNRTLLRWVSNFLGAVQ